MNTEQALAYVQATAAALALPLDTQRAARVAAHLQRTAELAALLDELSLPEDLEPAEVYRPKQHVPRIQTA